MTVGDMRLKRARASELGVAKEDQSRQRASDFQRCENLGVRDSYYPYILGRPETMGSGTTEADHDVHVRWRCLPVLFHPCSSFSRVDIGTHYGLNRSHQYIDRKLIIFYSHAGSPTGSLSDTIAATCEQAHRAREDHHVRCAHGIAVSER